MNWHAVRLVATREVRERSRARSFRITLVLSLVLVVAAVVLPKVLSGTSRPARLGVVGAAPDVKVLERAIGHPITVSSPPDEATARQLIRTKRLDVAVVGDSVLTRVTPAASDRGVASRLALALSAVLSRQAAYRAAHLTPAQIAALEATPPAAVTGLVANASDRTHQQVTTLIGIILLFSSIQLYGTWILFGVVEEKSSRIVEILLATLRTTELLAGKVLGIGVLALFQITAIATAALVSSRVSGSNVLTGASGATVIAMVGWFLLGYAFYSCLSAAGGSLVTRQSEAQNAQFPITLPLLVAYVTSFSSIFGTPSTFTVALSYLPPTAPIAMPTRIAAGYVPLWQIGLSVALLIVGTVAAVFVAARVYDRAILRTGGRLSWREALRTTGV